MKKLVMILSLVFIGTVAGARAGTISRNAIRILVTDMGTVPQANAQVFGVLTYSNGSVDTFIVTTGANGQVVVPLNPSAGQPTMPPSTMVSCAMQAITTGNLRGNIFNNFSLLSSGYLPVTIVVR